METQGRLVFRVLLEVRAFLDHRVQVDRLEITDQSVATDHQVLRVF